MTNWYKSAQIVDDMQCPECGSGMEFIEKGTYGPFYNCPNCPVTHSAFKSGKPRGIPGNLETIALRKAAHKKMDALAELYVELYDKDIKEGTKMVYQWVARKMGCPKDKCHMSLFDKKQLQQVIGLCEYAAQQIRKRLDDPDQLEFGI